MEVAEDPVPPPFPEKAPPQVVVDGSMVDEEVVGADGRRPPSTTRTLKVGGFDFEISEEQEPMIGVLFSSMVQLIAACVTVSPNHKYYEYAIALGAVGMGLSAFGIYNSWKHQYGAQCAKYMGWIIWLWSFIGGCILTFGRGPFVGTGNGYFATWGMLIFATQAVGVSTKVMKDSAYNGSSLLGLGLASVILIIGLSSELIANKSYKGNLIYALIIAIITLIFVDRLRDVTPGIKSAALTVLCVCWIVGACLLTFQGPFTYTGNGYFASWGAAFMCLFSANDDFLASCREWAGGRFNEISKMIPGRGGKSDGDDEEKQQATGASSQEPTSKKPTKLMVDTVPGSPPSSVAPHVELLSTEDKFVAQIDLPGVAQGDVDITLEKDQLIVTGTRGGGREDDASTTKTFSGAFDLDLSQIDVDNIDAKLENGVLTLSAPKKAQSKKILVSST